MDTRSHFGRPRRVARAVAVALAACCLLSASFAPRGDDAHAAEYRIKAAFLFKFLEYVRWPESAFENAETPYTVAVLGADPFGHLLDDALRGKSVAGRSVRAARFAELDELGGCHLLFVGRRDAGALPEILRRFGKRPVLLVGESEDFATAGGTLRFYEANDKVRFECNVDAARRAGLEPSSQLLKLARIVRDRPTSIAER